MIPGIQTEVHLLDLRISNLVDLGKVRVFPGEEFDYLDAGKEFLQKFGTLIRKNHDLPAGTKHEAYEPSLDRHYSDEDGETCQSTRSQVDQENDQTDDQLYWGGPAHVEELASEVDPRNVCGDVVHQFSVGVDMASTSGEGEGLVVDRRDQSRP